MRLTPLPDFPEPLVDALRNRVAGTLFVSGISPLTMPAMIGPEAGVTAGFCTTSTWIARGNSFLTVAKGYVDCPLDRTPTQQAGCPHTATIMSATIDVSTLYPFCRPCKMVSPPCGLVS